MLFMLAVQVTGKIFQRTAGRNVEEERRARGSHQPDKKSRSGRQERAAFP